MRKYVVCRFLLFVTLRGRCALSSKGTYFEELLFTVYGWILIMFSPIPTVTIKIAINYNHVVHHFELHPAGVALPSR